MTPTRARHDARIRAPRPDARPAGRGSDHDAGVALVLALCLLLVAAVVGASVMILAQTETYAGINYRSMTQARYAAESGVHKAINYLLNTYPAPVADADLANFDTTKTPVQYGGQPVVLSAIAGVPSNYPPLGTVQADFAAAAKGTLTVGGQTVQYAASATLLSMQRFFDYGTATQKITATWQLTGDGTTGGSRPGIVEVSSVLEQQKVAFNMYGFFATNNQCGALSFAGGVTTDSYDSGALGTAAAWTGGAVGAGVPVTQANNGNVGTNGNLTEGGGSVVNGTLSTPRTGVGHCSNGAVDALTANGNATVTGGTVQLPQTVSFGTPPLPSPLPPTGNVNVSGGTTCPGMGLAFTNCTGVAGNLILHAPSPLALADVKLTAGATLHFTAGTYNINSISLVGNSSVVIDSGPVVFNVVGTGATTPIDFGGGSVSNPSFVSENFQILYAGTNTLKVSGGAQTALMVYAPNAAVQLVGGSGVYGSIMGATIQDQGGTAVHYDRRLPSEFGTSWNNMLTSFSWKKQ